jgi:hypothetical protein
MPARPSASVMPLLTASVRAAARVSGVSTTDMLCKASQLSRSACRMISCARVACAFVGVCACVWVRASYISLLAHLRFCVRVRVRVRVRMRVRVLRVGMCMQWSKTSSTKLHS